MSRNSNGFKLLEEHSIMLRFIESIACDYKELSHEKIKIQRDDYIREANALLEELYGEDD